MKRSSIKVTFDAKGNGRVELMKREQGVLADAQAIAVQLSRLPALEEVAEAATGAVEALRMLGLALAEQGSSSKESEHAMSEPKKG